MKIYSQYIMNYSDSTQVTIDLQQDADFAKWKQTIEIELGGTTLGSLLIMPVQRVPRYILLLTELKNHTWKNHPDYANLQQAAEEMEKLTKFLDRKRQESENLNKLASISYLFKNKIDLNIVEPHRKLIREDSFNDKKILYLFNDLLIISENTKRLSRSRIIFSHLDSPRTSKCVFYYLTQLELVLTTTGFQIRQNGVHTILYSCNFVESDENVLRSWIDDFRRYKENADSCVNWCDADAEEDLSHGDNLKNLHDSYSVLQKHINTLGEQIKSKKHKKDKRELEALQKVFITKLQEIDVSINEILITRNKQHTVSKRTNSLDEDPLRLTVNRFRRTSTDTNWFNS